MSVSSGARLDETYPVLADLPMLQFMTPEVRRLVIDSFVPVEAPFGTVLVREGERADAMFVLASGRARAVKKGEDGREVSLGALKPGDTFGEAALLEHSTRGATVRASSEVVVLRLDASIVEALMRNEPRIRESFDLHARRRNLSNFFRLHSAFDRLPPDAIEVLLRELEPRSIAAGAQVVHQGDQAEDMFVVESGRLRAIRDDATVGYLRSGDFFGEVAMLKGSTREASVEAVTDVELLVLHRSTFDKLAEGYPEFRARLEDRISQYSFRAEARVPLDFAEEILPADTGLHEVVGPSQVEEGAHEGGETAGSLADDIFTRPEKPIRRFPFVWQVDEMDCGAACLAMVTRHFGREVSLNHIREAVETSLDGTSLLGIVEGAKRVGLDARSVKASKSRLDELPLPSIVHWSGNHWVVLHDVTPTHVRVADPGRGLRKIPRAEFLEQWSGYAALIAPTPKLMETPAGGTGLGWIWQFLRPHRRTFVIATVLSMIAAGMGMTIPVFGQIVVDRVIIGRDVDALAWILAAMGVTLVVMASAGLGQRFLLSRSAVHIDTESLAFISKKLLALPMRYFHTRRTGDISRRLTGIRQAREFLVQQGVMALTAGTQLIVALALMFVYSWPLALVFLSVAPLYLVLLRYSMRKLRPLYDSLEEAFGKYHSRQIDAIKGIETVKALAAEDTLGKRMTRQFKDLADRVMRADFSVMLFEGGIQAVAFLSLALFLWAGALQVIDGHMTLGQMLSFNALVLLANGPVVLLLATWDGLQFSQVLLNRLNDVFEVEPEQGQDRSRLRDVPTLEGHIRLAEVSFRYPGPGAPVLEEISMDVPAGTNVAIVGRSGSGKTTLAKCLAGLIEPTAGMITYDGVDMTTLDYRSLRLQIGFVLQENYLFDDTLARNIALGEDEPDAERVAWAARVANAAEFIERLPLGYDTKVGESGLLLSGGQRQRVAIARAIYRKPPVLILDEATSALDAESERAVQDNMDQLLHGRTSFVIAHRLSTVRDADVIMVLERGRLVEQGNHDALMARRGLYFYLVSEQLGLE